jgi:hypothetical protein
MMAPFLMTMNKTNFLSYSRVLKIVQRSGKRSVLENMAFNLHLIFEPYLPGLEVNSKVVFEVS